jgi:hypothetical protein
MPLMSTAAAAKQRPSHHVFSPGAGYLYLGELKPWPGHKTIYGTSPKDLCGPPPGTRDQSWHLLQAPQGSHPIAFQWLSEPKEWFRLETKHTARRLGFSPAYLSSHGWKYLGTAKGRHG